MTDTFSILCVGFVKTSELVVEEVESTAVSIGGEELTVEDPEFPVAANRYTGELRANIFLVIDFFGNFNFNIN